MAFLTNLRSFADQLLIARPRNRPIQKGEGYPAGTESREAAVGVFISPQSITSFPVAASVVAVCWQVAKKVWPMWGDDFMVPLVVAGAVGLLIFFVNATNDETRPRSVSEWIVASFLMVINSVFLAAAALGILTVATE